MSSQGQTRPSTLSTPVPLDMIEAWLRGEYLISQNESSGYELLGYSLMLRGLYVYTVTLEEDWPEKGPSDKFPKDFTKKIAAWGICKIDLRDGDILFHGIRLGLNTKSNSDKNKDFDNIKHVAWYSIFSKLTRVPGSPDPDMYFGYVLVPLHQDTVCPAVFQWFALMTKQHECKRGAWMGFQLPIEVPEVKGDQNRVIRFSSLYSSQFRASLCQYLDAKIEEDLDRHQLENQDEVSAIGHIKLEQWSNKMRPGLLQPTVVAASGNKPRPLDKRGKLHLFPLMDEKLGIEKSE